MDVLLQYVTERDLHVSLTTAGPSYVTDYETSSGGKTYRLHLRIVQ